MPIIEFHNRNEAALTLVVWPCGESREIPHLATAGVRYALEDGAKDSSSCDVSSELIEFWCNANVCDIDLVYPSAFEKLSWDICVNGGWCGIVDGQPTRVEDLLPKSGVVTARQFAELAIRADGWPASDPLPKNHLLWLEAKFIKHLGVNSVPAEDFHRDPAKPFGEVPG